jgi:N-acetyltransferase 10
MLDLLPPLARAYFAGRLPATLSPGQAAILALLGLQQRDVSACEKELNMQSNQILALFNKVRHDLWHLGLWQSTAARGVSSW